MSYLDFFCVEITERVSCEEDEDICSIPHINFNLEKSNGEIRSEIDPIMKAPLGLDRTSN